MIYTFSKKTITPVVYLLLLTFLFTVASSTASAQIQQDDKIDKSTAQNRKSQFHGSFNGSNRIPRIVKFSVSDLQEILNTFSKNDTIQFHFAIIRADDVEKYAKKAKLNGKDKKEMAQKATLLIKGAMPTAGLKDVVSGEVFYDIGVVCPPPGGVCD